MEAVRFVGGSGFDDRFMFRYLLPLGVSGYQLLLPAMALSIGRVSREVCRLFCGSNFSLIMFRCVFVLFVVVVLGVGVVCVLLFFVAVLLLLFFPWRGRKGRG